MEPAINCLKSISKAVVYIEKQEDFNAFLHFFFSNSDPQSLLLVYSSNVCQVWFILSWSGGASWGEKFRQWSGSSPLISASILIQKRFQIDKMERCSPSMHTKLGEHGAHRQSTDASPPMRSLSVVRGRHVE